VLIADTREQIEEARMRLARVGIEEVGGYLENGPRGWQQEGLPLATLPQITVEALRDKSRGGKLHVLDVRREGEWQSGHLENAELWPLECFRQALPPVDKSLPLAVHCKSGYRSTIACSLLMRAGYPQVTNVIGGFDAWQAAQLPSVQSEPIRRPSQV
jgi:hydroxyacylglutathione hydrolase